MKLWLAFATLAILAAGCRSGSPPAEPKGATGDVPGIALTRYTPKVELFAEHRAFLAGQPSRFAAHVTDLRDWSAVRQGHLDAIFTAADGVEQVFGINGPARPGIFQPIATLATPGHYHLRFRLVAPGLVDMIDAGEAVVFADLAAAREANPEEKSNPDEIAFLKEQQWKVPFMSAPVAVANVETGVSLQGEVKAAGGREAAIAAPATGRLVISGGRPPRLGDRVARGHILALLTPDEAPDEDRASLRAAAHEAAVDVRQAEVDLGRATRLVAAQAAPARRLEEARASASVARSRLAAAIDRLNAKGATLAGAATMSDETYRLAAPIAGTLVEARAVPGAHVAVGVPLFRIVDMRRVWVEARVPEAEINRVASARVARIMVPGDLSVRGMPVAVGAVLDPATRTAPALFEADNPHLALRIGMTARITAITHTVAGPVIPASAVVDDNGKSIAYVQTGGEAFERRALILGPSHGDTVLVVSGLRAGERVVTRGGYEMRLATLSDVVPAHGHEH